MDGPGVDERELSADAAIPRPMVAFTSEDGESTYSSIEAGPRLTGGYGESDDLTNSRRLSTDIFLIGRRRTTSASGEGFRLRLG